MVVVVMVRVMPAAVRRMVWDLVVGDHPRVLLGVATVDAATMVPVMMPISRLITFQQSFFNL